MPTITAKVSDELLAYMTWFQVVIGQSICGAALKLAR